ncbi:short-chain fatty acid transporter [Anaerobacillus isosaccharinicus]|uniref:Short-chain fatty acid transporter n=1 Tax=Anaerobacillus isosaccharinicus TaxID=1532552 RepID=A0A1S2MEL2_9BACI|nr:short-chain fatty acid transporter [Anaerobacillus isosaccharinicus]MBA5587868.1 short-chain fatty acid transporter [Anaerobacillus isosaccharinicus]QOY33978.1 short-chain fatty acid transporter [Anaerobacillus isosaccharinicus]
MNKLTSFTNRIMQRYLPDPFLFVIILTLVVFGLGIILTNSSPKDMVVYWGDGFWNLLAFAMQMVLILVTGYVLASSPFFKNVLVNLAKLAKTPGMAIILVTVVSLIASWINWGFGLVIGALFAKELARQVAKVDYRLLIASAYSGFIVWHGGLAGSIPLTIATPGHFSEDLIGIIPTSDTIFSTFNLFIVAVLFITLPILNRLMMNNKEAVYVDKKLLVEDDNPSQEERKEVVTPATRMENSMVLSFVTGALGLAYILYYVTQNGFSLNLNIVNFIFLFLGILFHKTPRKFLASVSNAVKNAGGIIIQFPFYAGIMGMMVASGLAGLMSEWFVAISTETTFPVFAFISAGIVNFFVPSGGGQWAVQAPIMLAAGNDLGVSAAKTAMAVAWGDAWTNMIQPFWALPALAIAGLKAKDIMGFCIIVLFISGIIISLGFLFF